MVNVTEELNFNLNNCMCLVATMLDMQDKMLTHRKKSSTFFEGNLSMTTEWKHSNEAYHILGTLKSMQKGPSLVHTFWNQ